MGFGGLRALELLSELPKVGKTMAQHLLFYILSGPKVRFRVWGIQGL